MHNNEHFYGYLTQQSLQSLKNDSKWRHVSYCHVKRTFERDLQSIIDCLRQTSMLTVLVMVCDYWCRYGLRLRHQLPTVAQPNLLSADRDFISLHGSISPDQSTIQMI